MSRGVLLLLLSRAAWAQTSPNADALLAQVADGARTARTWQAAGVWTTTGADDQEQAPVQFKIASRQTQPFAGRLEITGGANPLLRVCDGASQWTYYPTNNLYVRVILPQMSPCVWPLNAWPPIRNSMSVPALAGTSRVTVNGRPRQCQVIRGAFVPSPSWPRDGGVLSVCVDPATQTILRYELREVNPLRRVRIITFNTILRDVDLDSDLFKFRPPEGSRQAAVINWLDPMAVPENGAMLVSNEATAPLLVSMTPAKRPSYVSQAPKPGAVGLHAVIGADGIPRNIRVLQTLGAGWDRSAVEAVEKWRFEPSISGGKAVAVVTIIAVNF